MKSSSPESPSSKSSSYSSKSASKSKRKSPKFIPNLIQLSAAAKELPDAELWPNDNFLCPVLVDKKQKTIEFKRKQVTRGSELPYRWIYEGKVLIRNRDISEAL